MNVLIIEDEKRAANLLQRLLGDVAPEISVIAKIESVRHAISFLKMKPAISLIFADVQLSDGLSFEIFEQVEIECPIIFTTAYDNYAIEAFKTNGIDYLLKPIDESRLAKAILKVKQLTGTLNVNGLQNLVKMAHLAGKKSRFMVKVGDKIKSIPTTEIKAFYSLDKATFMHTLSNRTYTIDYSLDELCEMLDDETFFKINRKYIVSIQACNQILAWTNSRLKVSIDGIDDHEIVVAREKVQAFKQWLDQ